MSTPVDVNEFFTSLLELTSCFFLRLLVYFVEMDVAKKRIRAAAARKKEERLMKGAEEGDSSAPQTVSKALKRKADGDDARPSKKTVTIPGDGS